MSGWQRGVAGRHRARAAASALPATRTSPPMPRSSPRSRSTRRPRSPACGAPPMPGWSSTRTARSTSSKAASSRPRAGRLKEGVRLDTAGISSRDWESYPVLRFSEVPEVTVELVGARRRFAAARRRRGDRRPDRRGDRQRRRARARRPPARPAVDARAGHGGAVARLTRPQSPAADAERRISGYSRGEKPRWRRRKPCI